MRKHNSVGNISALVIVIFVIIMFLGVGYLALNSNPSTNTNQELEKYTQIEADEVVVDPLESESQYTTTIPPDWEEHSGRDSTYGFETALSLPPGYLFTFSGSDWTLRSTITDESWDYSTSVFTIPNDKPKNYYDGGSRRVWYQKLLNGEFHSSTSYPKQGDIVSVTEISAGPSTYLEVIVDPVHDWSIQNTETHYLYVQNNIVHILKPVSETANSENAKIPEILDKIFYSLRSSEI